MEAFVYCVSSIALSCLLVSLVLEISHLSKRIKKLEEEKR